MFLCEPVQNQACFRELPRAENQPVGTLDRLHQRLDNAVSGAIEPRLMMYFRPSATDIFNRVTFSSGTSNMKPAVGLGVVGTKTHTSFSSGLSWISASSLVRKPSEYIPAWGNSMSTTVLKEFLFPVTSASLTCFVAP